MVPFVYPTLNYTSVKKNKEQKEKLRLRILLLIQCVLWTKNDFYDFFPPLI